MYFTFFYLKRSFYVTFLYAADAQPKPSTKHIALHFTALRKPITKNVCTSRNLPMYLLTSTYMTIMVVTNSKTLLGLCQFDMLMSLILFIVENLVQIPNILVHRIILATSSTSVMLSLLEMYVITKGQYWYLLMSSVIRLGPMVILSSLWIFYSNR